MRYVAAALLCSMGEQEVSAANMEKILSSVGVEADKERLAQVPLSLNSSCFFSHKTWHCQSGGGRLQGQVH